MTVGKAASWAALARGIVRHDAKRRHRIGLNRVFEALTSLGIRTEPAIYATTGAMCASSF